MRADAEGFLYPLRDADKCLNCGLCDRICPVSSAADKTVSAYERFACQNRNEADRRASTSGGMFAAIAEEIIRQGGTVFAAGFDDSCHVVHKGVNQTAGLGELCMSKYVQSDLTDCFSRIHSILQGGKPVFFVGTPCQTEGLISTFVNGLPDKLYTADLVCYGVPSPGLYDKWIASLSALEGSPVQTVYFRDKKYGYAGVNVRVLFRNGRILEDRAEVKSYGKTMFSKIGLRPSCYECPFRGQPKRCDFTLGDFWEIGQYCPDMDDDKGTTLVSVYTEKGKCLLQGLENTRIFSLGECDIAAAERMQVEEQKLHKKPHPRREDFFRDSVSMDYNTLINTYLPSGMKEKAANVLKPLLHRLPFSKHFFRFLKLRKIKKR